MTLKLKNYLFLLFVWSSICVASLFAQPTFSFKLGAAAIPKEGEATRLQVSLRNISPDPVLVLSITLKCDGDPGSVMEAMPFQSVEADSADLASENVTISFRWNYQYAKYYKPTRKLSQLVSGGDRLSYLWLPRRAILLPNNDFKTSFMWIPYSLVGKGKIGANLAVRYVPWSQELKNNVFLLNEPKLVPEPPESLFGTMSGPSDIGFIGHFKGSPYLWDEDVNFANAIVHYDIIDKQIEENHPAAMLIKKQEPSLAKLNSQFASPITKAAYSPRNKTWFLKNADGYHIINEGQRFTLKNDFSDFIENRLLDGKDGTPWLVYKDRFSIPEEIEEELSIHPLVEIKGRHGKYYQVPERFLVDMLLKVDSLGFVVTKRGTIVRKVN